MAINNWTGFYIGAMGGYAKENTSDIGAISGGFAGGTVGSIGSPATLCSASKQTPLSMWE